MKKILLSLCLVMGVASSARADFGYYEQFLFQSSLDCKTDPKSWEWTPFEALESYPDVDLGKDSQGRPLSAQVRLQLFPDGFFFLHYQEIALTKQVSPAVTENEVQFEKKITGRWSVCDNQLIVSDLATGLPGEASIYDKIEKVVVLKLNKVIHDERMKGQEITLGYFKSNRGPNGQSMYQFCGVDPFKAP